MFEYILKHSDCVRFENVDNIKTFHFILPKKRNPKVYLTYYNVTIKTNLFGYDVWVRFEDIKDFIYTSEPLINPNIDYVIRQYLDY